MRPGTVHDLGKLMLAFVMLWAYVNLSQFLIIWSGNLPEEIPVLHPPAAAAAGSTWRSCSSLFHFVLPFLLLLSRDLKRNARLLGALAAAMLLASACSTSTGCVAPDLLGDGHRTVRLTVHWLDLAAPVGVGGALALLLRPASSATRPVLPVGEPEMAELLAARAGVS